MESWLAVIEEILRETAAPNGRRLLRPMRMPTACGSGPRSATVAVDRNSVGRLFKRLVRIGVAHRNAENGDARGGAPR